MGFAIGAMIQAFYIFAHKKGRPSLAAPGEISRLFIPVGIPINVAASDFYPVRWWIGMIVNKTN